MVSFSHYRLPVHENQPMNPYLSRSVMLQFGCNLDNAPIIALSKTTAPPWGGTFSREFWQLQCWISSLWVLFTWQRSKFRLYCLFLTWTLLFYFNQVDGKWSASSYISMASTCSLLYTFVATAPLSAMAKLILHLKNLATGAVRELKVNTSLDIPLAWAFILKALCSMPIQCFFNKSLHNRPNITCSTPFKSTDRKLLLSIVVVSTLYVVQSLFNELGHSTITKIIFVSACVPSPK